MLFRKIGLFTYIFVSLFCASPLFAQQNMGNTPTHIPVNTPTDTPTNTPNNTAQRVRLMILDVQKSEGIDENLPRALLSIASGQATQKSAIEVITQNDVKQLLDLEASKQLMGCDADASCMAEIGNAVGVPYIVTGTLAKVGSSYVLNLSTVDVRAAQVLAREAFNAKNPEDLLDMTKLAMERLLAPILVIEAGAVSIKSSEVGTTVYIDGNAVGVTPINAIKTPSGTHRVALRKNGFLQFEKDVVILPQQTNQLSVLLAPSPEFIEQYRRNAFAQQLWGWTAASVSLASVGGGVSLFAISAAREAELKQSLVANENGQFAISQQELDNFAIRDVAGISLLGAAAITGIISTVILISSDDMDRYTRGNAGSLVEQGSHEVFAE